MQRFELVIIGGGMVGLSLLAKLAPSIHQGLNVALIDPADHSSSQAPLSPSFDDRATALSTSTINALHNLKLPNLESALTAIEHIEVSDRGHIGFHRMSAPAQGQPRYGAIIANRALGSLLHEATQALNITRLSNQQVSKLKATADGYELTLTDQSRIGGELVILCDGGRSGLADQVGLSSQSQPFHAHARVATVKTTLAHQGVAFERFTEQGPIALLPFGEFSTLVWTMADAHKAQYPQNKADALAWLNQHFGQRLGKITAISDWVEYPLCERKLTCNTSHGLIALGNAATTLHPVAGQGFNLAMRGVLRTANLINQHYLAQQQLPGYEQLNQIGQQINVDQNLTAQLSRQLIRVFASTNPAVKLARGLGLGSLDRHPLFSALFAQAGMGQLASIQPLVANE